MDKIFLKGLKLKTRIGLFDWEKQIDQIINIDIEVGTDIKKAAETDDVSYSLDYKALSIKVKHYVDKPGAIRGSQDVGIIITRENHRIS